uniref:Uncharacterized protein n=1 Tax=Globodera rostochiensis TaxID=31243 RepID=A0A914GNU9_GLORO
MSNVNMTILDPSFQHSLALNQIGPLIAGGGGSLLFFPSVWAKVFSSKMFNRCARSQLVLMDSGFERLDPSLAKLELSGAPGELFDTRIQLLNSSLSGARFVLQTRVQT